MARSTLALAVLAALLAAPLAASPLTLIQTLEEPVRGASSEDFAASVALDADHAVVAERFGDIAGLVHLHDPATGAFVRTLSPGSGEGFGSAVAVADGFVASTGRGRVHVHEAATGRFQQGFDFDLASPISLLNELAVAMASDTLIVANRVEDRGDGRVHHHLRAPGTGIYELFRTFANPDPGAGAGLFGLSLAIDGESLLVGDPGHDSGLGTFGAAHLFDLTSGALVRSFLPGEASGVGSGFGAKVALDDGRALISWGGTGLEAAHLHDVASGDLLHAFASATPTTGGVPASLSRSTAVSR